MKKFLVSTALVCLVSVGFAKEWWQTWNNFPKVPTISAELARELVLAGKKVVFIYAGYEVSETVCGSIWIPYTLVPPHADGSRINLSTIPKDTWILCY